jgi:hypothetical protein
MADLRTLFETAGADGRLGQQPEALMSTLDAAQQALARGDGKAAVAQLSALQLQLLNGARAKTIAPDVLRQALLDIDTIARTHGLKLPLSVEVHDG